MPKTLLFILGVAVTLMSLVFLFGIRATPKVDTKFSADLDYTASYIFDFIFDVEKYPERKNNISKFEILERKGQYITHWKETYKSSLWREYKLIASDAPKYFEIELVNSSEKHTAVITYELVEGQKFTELKLTEKGEINHTFRRGMRFLAGDEHFLESEVKWIRVAIHNELINRP